MINITVALNSLNKFIISASMPWSRSLSLSSCSFVFSSRDDTTREKVEWVSDRD